MERRYASFLLRCWRLTGGRLRVEAHQIQTGEQVRVASLAEALAWLAARLPDPDERTIDSPPSSPATDHEREGS